MVDEMMWRHYIRLFIRWSPQKQSVSNKTCPKRLERWITAEMRVITPLLFKNIRNEVNNEQGCSQEVEGAKLDILIIIMSK